MWGANIPNLWDTWIEIDRERETGGGGGGGVEEDKEKSGHAEESMLLNKIEHVIGPNHVTQKSFKVSSTYFLFKKEKLEQD